ncbi:Protein DMR6-LIKE OXYGENASE 1 [Linum grandiflorum]
MNVLTQKLLGLISESLGVASSCIKDVVGEFYQNITVSYYPPCPPRPDLTLGLQSHSDFGATLLIQDQVSGLDVLKDSHWFPVQPLPEAIVVLVSDQTEVCKSDLFTFIGIIIRMDIRWSCFAQVLVCFGFLFSH